MKAIAALWRLSVVKKVLMALTGLALCGFVLGHMLGNLKIYLGREHFNDYAHWLRTMGAPLLPEGVALWLARLGLLACGGVHLTCAWQLYQRSHEARPERYAQYDDAMAFSRSSLLMRLGGTTLALFILFHLAHLTWGWIHAAEYIPGDPYNNVVRGFQHGWMAAIYLAAMVPLCLHLYHGVWSCFQTLGLANPLLNPFRRPLALGFALLIFVGNASIPLAVLAGVVKP